MVTLPKRLHCDWQILKDLLRAGTAMSCPEEKGTVTSSAGERGNRKAAAKPSSRSKDRTLVAALGKMKLFHILFP